MNIRNEEGKMRMHFSLGGRESFGGIMVCFFAGETKHRKLGREC